MDRIVHLASSRDEYSKALCGTPRGSEPLKPGAVVTCVVCLSLKENRESDKSFDTVNG